MECSLAQLKHSASEHLRWPSLRPGKNSFEGLCIATDKRKGGNNHFCEQLQADLKASLAVKNNDNDAALSNAQIVIEKAHGTSPGEASNGCIGRV